MRQRLVDFARAGKRRALAPKTIALQRLITAEAARFPAEAQAVFQAGLGLARERLSAAFEHAAAKGEVVVDSPTRTAEAFLSLLLGFDWICALYGVLTPEGDPGGGAERLVDCFLRAFAPPPGANH